MTAVSEVEEVAGMDITCVVGDATKPMGEGNRIIVHLCNDIGAWGKGFVLALSKRYPYAEQAYREWFRDERLHKKLFALGAVQIVVVEIHEHQHDDTIIWVANLMGQQGIRRSGGLPPIRYEAVRQGLRAVADFALATTGAPASVHMPRIGCGLAGGDWKEISRIVREELADKEVPVTVYDLA